MEGNKRKHFKNSDQSGPFDLIHGLKGKRNIFTAAYIITFVHKKARNNPGLFYTHPHEKFFI